MNHRGKKILGVVLALLLMAAGAGIILSARCGRIRNAGSCSRADG